MKVTKQGIARTAAWLLLANAMLGLAPWLWTWIDAGMLGRWPWLAFFGVASAVLALRGQHAGMWGSIVCCALQVCSYYAFSGAWSFSMKAGLSLAYVARLPGGMLIINVAAVVLLVASVLSLLVLKPLENKPAGDSDQGDLAA
jgi:hypothetical protein